MFSIVKSNRQQCRECGAGARRKLSNPLTKGRKMLCISVDSAGGYVDSYYCEDCVPTVMDRMKEFMAEWERFTFPDEPEKPAKTFGKSIWD